MKSKYFFAIPFLFLTLILTAQNRLYIHSNGKELGLVDHEGNLKTESNFDEIEDLRTDDWTNTKAFLIKKNELFGLMDDQGQWIFPLKYSEISCKNDTCKLKENLKAGYATVTKKIIIPLEYDELGFIGEQKIKALKNGKWGFINLKNEWVIPPKFDQDKLEVFDFSEDMAKVCLIERENGCGYIDLKGEMIIPQNFYEFSGDFQNGLARTRLNDKLAYLNKSGKIAVSSDWNDSSNSDFNIGVAVVSKNCRRYDDYGVCDSYLINTNGENVLPKDCILERSFPEENYAIVRNFKTQKLGVVDNQGKIIVPIEFSDIGNYEGPFNWIQVSKYNKDDYEMSGFYDRNGKKITDPIYSICGSYLDETNANSETFICIERQNGEGRGALDKTGKAILPPDFDDVDFADGVFKVSKLDRKAEIGGIYNPSCGYLNADGSVLIPLKYKTCSRFNNGLATVSDGNGFKIINKKNETVKDLGNQFEKVSRFSHGFSNVGKNGNQGMINEKGEITIPLIYDYIYHYNDVIQVRNGEKHGIIDNTGKIIVPLIYEDTSLQTCNGKVYGKKGEKLTWYNLEGKKLNDRIPLAQCSQ